MRTWKLDMIVNVQFESHLNKLVFSKRLKFGIFEKRTQVEMNPKLHKNTINNIHERLLVVCTTEQITL